MRAEHEIGLGVRTTRRTPGRGIALLMVITVLVTLVLVAVPFAISMRQGRERTTSETAASRALFEADLLLEAMKHGLARSHPMLELERQAQGEAGVDADPAVDSLAEIDLGDDFRRKLAEAWDAAYATEKVKEGDPLLRLRVKDLRNRGLGPLNDDRGSI